MVYADWPVPARSPWVWAPLALGLSGFAALWALRMGRTRPLLIALGYHALAVLPVLGLVEMAFHLFSPIGNHLHYLALMGPLALVAAGLGRVASGRWHGMALAAAALLVLALGVRTFQRASAYRDDVSLWTRAVEEAPESLTAARMLTGALEEADRRAEGRSALQAAAGRIRDPASKLRARALLLAQLDQADDSVAAEREATALRQDLGFRYELGVILSRGGHPAAVLPLLEDLVRRQPGSADNRYQLASALARTGLPERARAELEIGCRLAPRRSDCCAALAMLLQRTGRGGEVRSVISGAMGLPPWDPEVDEVLRIAIPGSVR